MKAEKKLTFGRIFWPTFWSALIVSILGLIIWLIVISGIISSFETESGLMVKDKTILHLELNGPISDKANSEFDPMSFSMSNTAGLTDILHALEEAKTDKKIKGLFIEIDNLSCGFATAKEIRDAINDFESSGKFVVAYKIHLLFFLNLLLASMGAFSVDALKPCLRSLRPAGNCLRYSSAISF